MFIEHDYRNSIYITNVILISMASACDFSKRFNISTKTTTKTIIIIIIITKTLF